MPRQSAPAAAAVVRRQDPKEAYDAIQKAIEEQRDKLTRSLAAVHVSPERFLTVVDQALRRSPRLLECTPTSILKAMLDAAELGLVPSGLIGQAYLVPYRNKHTGRQEAQLIPGYRGLCDLARRSGDVKAIEARTVRANDEFEIVFGTDGFVRHVPYINRTAEMVVETPDPAKPDAAVERPKDGGPYIGAYMIATLGDGVKQVEWMTWPEIMGIKRRSKAASDGPWVTDEAEMAKKTVTRRGVKYLPVAIDSPLNRALALEDAAESMAAKPRNVTPSDARKGLEAALGIGEEKTEEPVEEPVDETVDETPICGEPDAEGFPCLKPPGHDPDLTGSHESAAYVWPMKAPDAAE